MARLIALVLALVVAVTGFQVPVMMRSVAQTRSAPVEMGRGALPPPCHYAVSPMPTLWRTGF